MSPVREIAKAVRRGRKARIAFAGPSGSGKTWTSLLIAEGLVPGGKYLVIDTERGSSALYADRFDFQLAEWDPPYDPRELATFITEQSPKYDVVIIDSMSHFWQGEGGTLDIVDGAAARAQGNKFAGWKTGTPAQNDMVNAMLLAQAHVIATMRSKMEYVQEREGGKTVIRKVGMQPIQREGIEYEFTVTSDIDIEHRITVSKTRCAPLADKHYQPGHAPDMAKVLRDWLEAAEADPELADEVDRARIRQMYDAIDRAGRKDEAVKAWKEAGLPSGTDPHLTKAQAASFQALLSGFLPEDKNPGPVTGSDEAGGAEDMGRDQPAPPAEPKANALTQAQSRKLHACMRERGVQGDDRHPYLSKLLDREITSVNDLTREEAAKVIDTIESMEPEAASA